MHLLVALGALADAEHEYGHWKAAFGPQTKR
jgi:hypothetical protein